MQLYWFYMENNMFLKQYKPYSKDLLKYFNIYICFLCITSEVLYKISPCHHKNLMK